jgi:5-dehydro-2-deoxygluconokinase
MAADADEFALPATRLDVITIGRSSVDLYGQQIGSRLEDVATFAKSVGGCPSNIAIGTARLGLRSGLITRVGDEQMGRYILEQMARENVATDGIVTDPERLSALVLLSVENDETFPLIFYRENCADMALCEDDIDADFVSSAKAIVVSGTHFSQANTDAAQRKAIRIARDAGRKVVFDIDYRPNLWRLTGHAAGEERYIASRWVTKRLKSVLADCDLIVGTEEEIHIAAGQEDTLAALRAIRDISDAAIVLKRGPMGCVVYPGAIPGQIEDGIVGAGFPVEVYNVLGAGDAFMSGFLRGWLCDESLATCATWANACGAFAVSRLLCSPEIPTWAELQYFLENGSLHRALRHDAQINHVHWSTTRRPQPSRLMVLAIDHRAQMLAMAEAVGAPPERISAFKTLAVEATARIADGRPGYGVLLDETYGRKAMVLAAENGLWIGRPVEDPGSRPLRFEVSQDIGGRINEWPVTHTVKCLAFYHPDDNPALKAEQTDKLQTLHEAVRRAGRELLVEIIASKNGPLDNNTTARVLAELYAFGIKPDWWKLEPQASPGAWQGIEKVVSANDSRCRGIVLLGLDAPQDKLLEGFAACTDIPLVRGFAIGRTVFNSAASKWLAGDIDDNAAIADMAGRFGRLVEAWPYQRGGTAA